MNQLLSLNTIKTEIKGDKTVATYILRNEVYLLLNNTIIF